jgi:hypothetical protein
MPKQYATLSDVARLSGRAKADQRPPGHIARPIVKHPSGFAVHRRRADAGAQHRGDNHAVRLRRGGRGGRRARDTPQPGRDRPCASDGSRGSQAGIIPRRLSQRCNRSHRPRPPGLRWPSSKRKVLGNQPHRPGVAENIQMPVGLAHRDFVLQLIDLLCDVKHTPDRTGRRFRRDLSPARRGPCD